jgi:hypothetical protein
MKNKKDKGLNSGSVQSEWRKVRSSAIPPPCHACGRHHAANAWTGYYWKAVRSSNPWHPDGWNVLAITECGAMANTEAVASFVGKYHNAQRNAEECVGFHNTALLKRLGGAFPHPQRGPIASALEVDYPFVLDATGGLELPHRKLIADERTSSPDPAPSPNSTTKESA